MNPGDMHICISTLVADPFSFTADDWDACLDAVVAAGLSGISIWSLHHFMAGASGRSGDDLAAQVRALGLEVSFIEAIPSWANAPTTEAAVADAAPNLDIAALYGAPYVGAVLLDPEIADVDQTVANLAAIADAAAAVDVTICIEYLPWSGISDIGTCWDLIQRCERDNVGFLFDSWHWHRQAGGDGPENSAILASIPAGRIPVFQLCDALAEPVGDPMAETMEMRPLPGEGVVDHAHLFALFDQIGADPLVVPEVFNRDLVTAGPTETAQAIAEASRTLVSRYRG